MQNNAKDLVALMDQASTFMEHQSLPRAVVYKATLVMEEVLTNIVKYAFEDTCVHEISVLLSLNDPDLVIRFEDDGREFNPVSAPPPVMKECVQESTEGGLGIYLVRRSVKSIEYRREQSRNVLTTTISLNSQ